MIGALYPLPAALEILASAPLLVKFVSEVAAIHHELRKRGTGNGGPHRIAIGGNRKRALYRVSGDEIRESE
jgi:hypothetical protein